MRLRAGSPLRGQAEVERDDGAGAEICSGLGGEGEGGGDLGGPEHLPYTLGRLGEVEREGGSAEIALEACAAGVRPSDRRARNTRHPPPGGGAPTLKVRPSPAPP